MDRMIRTVLAIALLLCTFGLTIGCGQQPAGEQPAAASPASTGPQFEAISQAAADFLDAVLKGDTQRASARLTPQAMQRIIASGKQFAPPGLETASFRIGQVRVPGKDQAIVQCVLTDVSQPQTPRNEEMCCLMKFVENDWRVSGIAYGTSPTQPWTLSNFETGQNVAIPRPGGNPGAPPTMAGGTQSPGTTSEQGRPSQPHTAQEPTPVVR